jgi:hypothetical protein
MKAASVRRAIRRSDRACSNGRLYPDHDQDGARGNRPGGEVLFPALAAPHGDLDIGVDRILQPIGDIAQAVEAVGLVNLVKPLCQQLLNIIEIADDGFDVWLQLGGHGRSVLSQKELRGLGGIRADAGLTQVADRVSELLMEFVAMWRACSWDATPGNKARMIEEKGEKKKKKP